ncbi:MAG: VacJ family lipoprotein [Deltaproteobacteria bacterium]|nr:MAG: VacJ family lipoprotein [Deltaproteobacteria bacterium]
MTRLFDCLPALLILGLILLSPTGRVWADGQVPPTLMGSQDEVFDDPFDDPFAEEVTIADPLEPLNRGFFWVNDKLYILVFKPVARALRIIPEPGRLAVDRFFTNLETPVRLANCVLQLKPGKAGTELGRFLVNSTVGLLGLFDPAEHWFGWKRHDEDLGQTFGHYGVGQGIYLVLPIFGPTSLRDGVGLLGDSFIDPISSPWYLKLRPWEQIALKAADKENTLSLDKDTYDSIRTEQLDPYLFVRDAWAQHRRQKVED